MICEINFKTKEEKKKLIDYCKKNNLIYIIYNPINELVKELEEEDLE